MWAPALRDEGDIGFAGVGRSWMEQASAASGFVCISIAPQRLLAAIVFGNAAIRFFVCGNQRDVDPDRRSAPNPFGPETASQACF